MSGNKLVYLCVHNLKGRGFHCKACALTEVKIMNPIPTKWEDAALYGYTNIS